MDVLGVSFDTVEENHAFAEKFSFPYPLLCDTSRAVGLAYGACKSADDGYAARNAVLIGPNGVVLHVFESVDARNFATTLLASLQKD